MLHHTDSINNEKMECLHVSSMKKISWTAILTGALVGVGITFLLNLFSIAISLSAISNNNGIRAIAVGGLIGVIISVIASMFTAGWVAGYLGRPFCVRRNLGALYGFTTWCVALIITILIATNIGRFVSVYTNFITSPTTTTFVATKTPTDENISSANTSEVAVDNQKLAENLALSSYIVFALFFIGALASCFGGHCGMCYRSDKEEGEVGLRR